MTESLTSGDRKRVQHYFVDPRKRLALVVLFLGLVLIELVAGKLLLLAGFFWLLVGLAIEAKRPSDEEVDALVSRDVQALVQEAMRRFAPRDDEIRAAPLALLGTEDHRLHASHSLLAKSRTGRDGTRRSTLNQVVILLPMEDQLGIFSCLHDSLMGVSLRVSSEEHHYHDIVTLGLREDIRSTRSRQVFSLELNNGRHLSFPVSVAWQEGRGSSSQHSGLEQALLAIRTLMRDKR